MTENQEITRLLRAFRDGDRSAFDRLFELVYADLCRRAHFQLRELGGSSLATTGLVHEAYIKLVAARDPDWECRRHFYRVAARAMRQIVIDRARRHLTSKRGGSRRRLDIDRMAIPVHDASEQLVALDLALLRLEEESPSAARVFELSYFVGLTVEETAAMLDTSPRTVKRLRQFSRAFLHAELTGEPPDGDSAGVASRGADPESREVGEP